jgi:NSS family neurotransmitter:Na+ symporter
MTIRESAYGQWSSQGAFVMVALGAVVGIGNVVRLPYLAATYGGLAFMLVYVLVLLIAVWPMLAGEWMLGRWGRQDLVRGMRRTVREVGASRGWVAIGWLSVLAALLILSFYSVIAGWSLGFALRSAVGLMPGGDAANASEVFLNLAQDGERTLAWHTIFMVCACIVVAHGLRSGLERITRYLLLTSVFFAAVLLLMAARLETMDEALAIWLHVDWSAMGWRGYFEAIQQACFSLSLGVGAMMIYGSYLSGDAPVGRLALLVISLDTLFGIVAGTAVYALVFASGQGPSPGLTMIFQTFPVAVADMGNLASLSLYLMLAALTLASAIALMEPVTVFLMERRRYTRVYAASCTAVVIWLLGLGTVVSFGSADAGEWMGRNFFEWVQWFTVRVAAPVTLLLIVIFVGRILPLPVLQQAWGQAEGTPVSWPLKLFRLALIYPARVVAVALILYCLGLIDALVALWSVS